MTKEMRAAARERIATACLAAILSQREEWGAGQDGWQLAEIACDYADSLVAALERRQAQDA